jgi:hypothetical protein
VAFISELGQIFIERFYTGWITLRNQLTTPIRVMGRRVIELYDALIAGNDWEVTPKLSLKRRAGHTAYQVINFPAMLLYSWKTNTQGTIPVFDTTQDVEYIGAGGLTVITSKTPSLGINLQSSILGIGNYLYVGNPQISFKFDGPNGTQGKTNWGIASGIVANGPNIAGTGANGTDSGIAWTNPNNVTSGASYATVALTSVQTSQSLLATNFGFVIPGSNTITGIGVTFDAYMTAGQKIVDITLLKNGIQAGTAIARIIDQSPIPQNIMGGSPSYLWGTTWQPSEVDSTGFGVAFKVQGGGLNATVNLRNVKITIYGNLGPTATPTGVGSFSAVNGFTYVDAYGNSVSGEISNATPVSASTGPFTNKAYVGIPIAPSTDPQVNQIRVYRSTDSGGGNQFFEIANSPFPNIGYTLTSVANASGGNTVYTGTAVGGSGFASAVGQNFQVTGFANGANNGTFTAVASSATTLTLNNAAGVAETHAATANLIAEDTTPDVALQVTSQAEINLGNTPPPAGLINLAWWSGRMWGSVNNLLFASTGPETLSGTAPNSNWNPEFQFLIPGVIIRNVPWTSGMLVFTQDDCYIVRGTDITNYTVNEFIKDFGTRTYNAIDTDGTNIYVFTSDKQFILLSSSGAEDIGLAIADQLQNLDPTSVYVKINRYGLDSIVRILDTVNNVYYDYNLNQQCWNLPGILQMPACTAMGSIETSPGVWRLLLSSNNSGTVTLAFRDIANFQDLGTSYSPKAVFGSIQLADPGMLAKMGARGGFVLQYTSAGSLPVLSVLPNDAGATLTNAVGSQITGNFVSLSVGGNPVQWPPTLGMQPVAFRNLGYFYAVGKSLSAYLLHLQFQLAAPAENAATELLGWGIFGDYKSEATQAGPLPQLQGK